MIFYWLLAAAMVFIARVSDPDSVKFTLKPYLKFLTFMFWLCAIRLTHLAIDDSVLNNVPWLGIVSAFDLSMVWWEDALFTLPALLAIRNRVSKIITIPMIATLSIAFAAGHLYQGYFFAAICLAYVPVGLYYGKKYGLATVAACHVTWDLTTYLTIIFWMAIR